MKKKFISVATFCAVIASMPAWVGCSDYDDDIQNLQGQITANATDLSGLVEEKANALTQEINNLKSQDATLTTALETAKAELNAAIEEAKSYADVQAEAAQVAAIEAAKAEVATAREALEAALASANEKIDGLNTTVSSQGATIESLLSADQTMQNAISEANAAIVEARELALTAQGTADANKEELAKVAENLATTTESLNGQISVLGERVDEAYSQIAANKAEVEGQLEMVNSLIKTNADAIAALQEKDEALDAKDAELLASILENAEELAALGERLAAAEALIEQNLNAAKSYTDAQIALVKTSLGLTDGTSIDLPAAIARLGAAEEAIEGIKESIAGLTEKDEELQGLIDAVEGSVASITVQVGEISNQVNNNTEAIKSLGQDVLTNANQIEALQETVAQLQKDLDATEAAAAEALKTAIANVMEEFKKYATTEAMNKLQETLTADYKAADDVLRGELTKNVDNLQKQIDAINLSDFQGQIDDLTDSLEVKYTALKNQIGAMTGDQGAITLIDEKIQSVAGRVTTLETNLDALTDNVKGLTDRMDAAENEINQIWLEMAQNSQIVGTYITKCENELGALTGFTSQLRSLVFNPETYYQGIEAIGVWSYNYKAILGLVAANGHGDTDQTKADNPNNKALMETSVVPDVTASYYLNPSNAAVDVDPSKYSILLNNASYVRGISKNNIKVEKVDLDKVEGKIDVTFSMKDANSISDINNGGKVDVMALRYNYAAESGDTLITSDFAALKQFVIKEFAINKVREEGATEAENELHLAATAEEALTPNAPKLSIEYNNAEGINLNKWINVHYVLDGNNKETTWGGQNTIGKKNFKLVYELMGYVAKDTDGTNESQHATINNDSILNVHGVGETTTSDSNRKIIGRTPLVRVKLVDGNSNNQVAAVGYILVNIVDVNAGNITVDADAITNGYTVTCDDDAILNNVTAITWLKVENEVLGQLNMSKVEFEATYKVSMNGSVCQQYVQDGENFTAVDGIGQVVNTNDPASHETRVLQWSVGNQEAYDLFVEGKENSTEITPVSTWVKFAPVTGHGQELYVKLTWAPDYVNKTPTATILDSDKKRADWHVAGSREQGYEELHIQVGNATEPNAECKFSNLIINDRFNTTPIDVIKRDLASQYKKLADAASVEYLFDLSNENRKYTGASGKIYTLRVIDNQTGIEATTGGVPEKVAEINPSDGKITLSSNNTAKDIINTRDCKNWTDVGNALKLSVVIVDHTCAPAGDLINLVNNDLDVRVIKPVYLLGGSIASPMVLNNYSTLTQKVSLEFEDFNGYDPSTFYDNANTKGTTFWGFYGITSIEQDPERDITTDYSGTDMSVANEKDFQVTFTAPTGGISLDNMGSVTLTQGENMSMATKFNVSVPVKVHYTWGDLYTTIDFTVYPAGTVL